MHAPSEEVVHMSDDDSSQAAAQRAARLARYRRGKMAAHSTAHSPTQPAEPQQYHSQQAAAAADARRAVSPTSAQWDSLQDDASPRQAAVSSHPLDPPNNTANPTSTAGSSRWQDPEEPNGSSPSMSAKAETTPPRGTPPRSTAYPTSSFQQQKNSPPVAKPATGSDAPVPERLRSLEQYIATREERAERERAMKAALGTATSVEEDESNAADLRGRQALLSLEESSRWAVEREMLQEGRVLAYRFARNVSLSGIRFSRQITELQKRVAAAEREARAHDRSVELLQRQREEAELVSAEDVAEAKRQLIVERDAAVSTKLALQEAHRKSIDELNRSHQEETDNLKRQVESLKAALADRERSQDRVDADVKRMLMAEPAALMPIFSDSSSLARGPSATLSRKSSALTRQGSSPPPRKIVGAASRRTPATPGSKTPARTPARVTYVDAAEDQALGATATSLGGDSEEPPADKVEEELDELRAAAAVSRSASMGTKRAASPGSERGSSPIHSYPPVEHPPRRGNLYLATAQKKWRKLYCVMQRGDFMYAETQSAQLKFMFHLIHVQRVKNSTAKSNADFSVAFVVEYKLSPRGQLQVIEFGCRDTHERHMWMESLRMGPNMIASAGKAGGASDARSAISDVQSVVTIRSSSAASVSPSAASVSRKSAGGGSGRKASPPQSREWSDAHRARQKAEEARETLERNIERSLEAAGTPQH